MPFQKCRAGHTIRIGNGVDVTILESKQGRVRVSIQAPHIPPDNRREGWVQFRKAPEIERRTTGRNQE